MRVAKASCRVFPGRDHCGAQVKLVLTSMELLKNQTSRKEIPHSELDGIQPWMSLGWS